MISNTTVAY